MGAPQQPEVSELFQLPLDRFTAARNELAARLAAEGKREAATAVKALAKPPASAWAVNQVYWKARAAFDELLRAGRRLADAQRRGADGDALRDAIRERRGAVQSALRQAEKALGSAGHAASPQVLRRVASTLEALASGNSDAVVGALTADLEAPGFDALLGAAPLQPRSRAGGGSAGAKASGDTEDKARAGTEAARQRRRADEATAALAEARERLSGGRRELDEARRRLDRAQERVDQYERAVAEAEDAATKAESLADEAQQALRKGRRPGA